MHKKNKNNEYKIANHKSMRNSRYSKFATQDDPAANHKSMRNSRYSKFATQDDPAKNIIQHHHVCNATDITTFRDARRWAVL